MTVGEAPPILLYTRFKVILPDSVSVSTACFPKEYPGSPNRCCPMMSVYFSKSMTGRTTEGGATASNSSVPLPPRRRRREACRRLRVLSSHRTQRGFRPAGAGLLSESERWISCRDGFRFEMNRRMFFRESCEL